MKHKLPSFLFLGLAALAVSLPTSRAAVLLSTADTYIASNLATTNYSGERFALLRAVSAATRVSFVQFTLPTFVPANLESASLKLFSGTLGSGYPAVQVLGTSTAINLSTLTWDSAISSNVLTGTGRNADFTANWGTLWTSFNPETLALGSQTTSSNATYTDSNAAAGMLKFLRENSGNTVTLALGFAATETSGGWQFRTRDDSGSGVTPTPPGPWAPELTLTVIPEPSTALLAAGAFLALLAYRRRRN